MSRGIPPRRRAECVKDGCGFTTEWVTVPHRGWDWNTIYFWWTFAKAATLHNHPLRIEETVPRVQGPAPSSPAKEDQDGGQDAG